MMLSRTSTGSLQAQTQRLSVKASAGPRLHASRERVLRYPDGNERVINYPTVAQEEAVGYEEVDDEYCPWLNWAWGKATTTTTYPPAPPPSPMQDQLPLQESLTFSWEEIMHQAADTAEKVKNSYQILHGCPWLLPKPMFVLTLSHGLSFDNHQHFHTLQTRVEKSPEITEELGRVGGGALMYVPACKVLGNASLAGVFSLSDMVDGVVAFSSRQQAEIYAANMMAEDVGNMDIHICEVSSHELFRLAVTEAKGCVVAVGFNSNNNNTNSMPTTVAGLLAAQLDAAWMPAPHQLATSLRGKTAWEL